MPDSISTKAPNVVTLRTLPRVTVPTGKRASRSSHGSGSSCFMPREIFLSRGSILSTFTCTVWPNCTRCVGCLTCSVQDISEMWTRPSMPRSISTKAP